MATSNVDPRNKQDEEVRGDWIMGFENEEEFKKARGDYLDDEEDNKDSEDTEDTSEKDDEDVEDDTSDEELEDKSSKEETTDIEEEHKTNIQIPKYRFDEVNEAKKSLASENEKLRDTLNKFYDKISEREETVPKSEVIDYDAELTEARHKLFDALAESDAEKALNIQKGIDIITTAQLNQRLEEQATSFYEKTSTAIKTQTAEDRFKDLAQSYQKEYSYLDTEDDNYSEDAVEELRELLQDKVAAGKPKDEALKSAMNTVNRLYGKKKETNLTDALSSTKKKDSVKRNIDTEKRQPPQSKGASSATDHTVKIEEIAGMSERKFRELTKDKKLLAELRGDVL